MTNNDEPSASVRRNKTRAIEPRIVVLQRGSFKMGSEGGDIDERPVHEVTIDHRLAVGRYPVTFDEYDRFAEATERVKPDDAGWGRGRRPVINVSLDDATAYVEWLSKETGKPYRLLTEAEWEYACRAGTETPYCCGMEITDANANFGNPEGKTMEVGTYPANPWRLHDMHGNVWEWVEDVWHENYDGAPDDGSAWMVGGNQSNRVRRGGSWINDPWVVRDAHRNWASTWERYTYAGFRVAMTLP